MTNITVSLKKLERKIGKKMPLAQLEHSISMMGVGVEGVSGDTITLDVTPNRPDLLCEASFYRAFLNFISKTKVVLDYPVIKSDYRVVVESSLKNIRPYTVCAIIDRLSFDDEKIASLINMQEKLHASICRNRKKAAIGIYPLSAIVFPVYFKAMHPDDIKFVALDAKDEQRASEILSQTDAGKAYGYLLEGLPLYPVFVDTKGDVLSMPPIINSEKTGRVDNTTKSVFIEGSGFDLNFLSLVLNIVVSSMMQEGAKIYSVSVDYKTKKVLFPNFSAIKNKLDVSYAQKLLGIPLKESDIKKALNKMGHEYKNGFALTPAWRADILHQIDLIEEIAIGYGYENFSELSPNISTVGQQDKFNSFLDQMAMLLVGQGFFEVNTLELTSYENLTKKMRLTDEPISIKNSISEKYNKLRGSMLSSLIEVLASNIHNDYPQKIFEIGKVFVKTREQTRLCVVKLDARTSFTEIKQACQEIFVCLGLKETYVEAEHPSFIEGRVASVKVKNKEVGILGEISPYVLQEWGLSFPVCAMEINLDVLFELV